MGEDTVNISWIFGLIGRIDILTRRVRAFFTGESLRGENTDELSAANFIFHKILSKFWKKNSCFIRVSYEDGLCSYFLFRSHPANFHFLITSEEVFLVRLDPLAINAVV